MKPGTNHSIVCVCAGLSSCICVSGCVVLPFWYRVFLHMTRMINIAVNSQNVESPQGC